MTTLREHQRLRNQATRRAGDHYASHRARVMRLIEAADAATADRKATLALLGAGNCLDVELETLVRRFDSVTLVDCDPQSVEQAVRAAALESSAVNIATLDVTGAFETLDGRLKERTKRGDTRPLDPAATLDLLRQAAPPTIDGQPFTVTASLCLLSQLIDRLTCYLGDSVDGVRAAAEAVRDSHLRNLLRWTAPGGTALLLLDVTSTDTSPQLRAGDPEDLSSTLAGCLRRGDFFLGLHPGSIHKWLCESPEAGELVESTSVERPWLWDLGERAYAVTCLAIRRSK